MASKQGTTLLFKVAMFMLFVFFGLTMMMLFGPNKAEKHAQVAKPVTTAKVVEKTEVTSRVVRDIGATSDSNSSNGPVTVELDLNGIGFDLKNSK